MKKIGLVGINVLVERNWTWVSGNTYPVKEELKAQGFYWSTKRRAGYNRSIVDVKLNNGNGIKTRENTFVKEKTTTKTTIVKAKVKEEEISEHDKALLEGNYKIKGKFPSEEKEVESTDKESLTVQKEATFSKEEKHDIAVFACVVLVWIGIRVTGVF